MLAWEKRTGDVMLSPSGFSFSQPGTSGSISTSDLKFTGSYALPSGDFCMDSIALANSCMPLATSASPPPDSAADCTAWAASFADSAACFASSDLPPPHAAAANATNPARQQIPTFRM